MGQKASVETVEKRKNPASPRNQALMPSFPAYTMYWASYPASTQVKIMRNTRMQYQYSVSIKPVQLPIYKYDGHYRNNLLVTFDSWDKQEANFLV